MAVDPALSWTFVAVGAAALGGAVLAARRTIRLMRAGGRARGKVLGNEESMIAGGKGPARKFYFPVIVFTTAKGEQIRFTSGSGQPTARAKDSEVRVLYDPERPYDAELATFKTLWYFPAVITVFGLPFLAAGLVGLLGS